MKTVYQTLLILIGALTGIAYGQQPPDVVVNDSCDNMAMGGDALLMLTPVCTGGGDTYGYENTAGGAKALSSNTTGFWNTAYGGETLEYNVSGYENTAVGVRALYANTGSFNTGVGVWALGSNTTGGDDTALGASAMSGNTTGNDNTTEGANALFENTSGSYNTALGTKALTENTTASNNTATGYYALYQNTTGGSNTASGVSALYTNRTGFGNAAFGLGALRNNLIGSYNIAQGYKAGYKLTTGSYNIDIGNDGVTAESGVMRVGTSGQQTQTFIAGINNSTVTGAAVLVDPLTGQLGVLASSERFKTSIAPMGSNTAKLQKLRPVIFKLKSDMTGTRQYGLIAEEVAKVYPELVIRGNSGRVDGVRYDELAPMLLNELQKEQVTISAQNQKIASLEQQVAVLNDLKQELHAALIRIQAEDELVATR